MVCAGGLRVRCSKCGTDNAENSRFCDQCATPLSRLCAKCSFENSPQARFCAQCAAPLGPALNERDEAQTSSTTYGERRHLTILFCDLVGSVTLTSQLDPEEWRATVEGYQRTVSEAIRRLGGEVVRYVGDGIMAFFGYPAAHDDDAERAARAGLALLDAIAQFNQQRAAQPALSVRIGIDSGPVVVGTGAGQAIDAFGDAANIAARVQATAEPNTVVVTGGTHRLISGLFVVEDRGAHQLKGIERPVQLYRIARPSGIRSRFEAAAAARSLTPFVGREDELRSLLSRWERAREGEGQVVTIVGEAGIGKSRLVRRFHEQLAGTPHTWIEAGAGAFFQSTPFYPIGETLRQFLSGDTVQEQVGALASRVAAVGLQPAEAIPLVAPLLNLSLPPEYPPSSLSPEQQRRRLLATLVEWLLGSAGTQPLVNVIEDLHWADPSTLEFIQLLVEQGATAPLLLLYTARPEFHPPWPLRGHHTQITLNRLSVRDIHVMVQEVAAHKALSGETVAAVVERTGGVPLFVEELTRVVVESGDGKLIGRSIPVTLHDSLMARLDRLGPAKEVAQVGAVIGAEFSYELLHAIHPIADHDLQSALQRLTDAELLYARGIAPDATYQFKHALIRDAAYEALLKSRRRELHYTVARTIVEKFLILKEAHPEVLARHWTEAGEVESAIAEWEKAAERAFQRGAVVEAESQYRRGLELLGDLDATAERDECELKLQMGWARTLSSVKGWSDPDSRQGYKRAQELCEKLGRTIELATVLNGLSASAFTRGEMRVSLEIAESALELAERSGDSALQCAAHRRVGESLLFHGDFNGARTHLELSSGFFNESDGQRLATLGAILPSAITALAYLVLGFPDRARRLLEETVSNAQPRGNPYELAFARMYGCVSLLTVRDALALREYAKQLKLHSENVPFFSGHADVYAGLASRMLNDQDDSKGMIRRGIAFWKANNFRLTRSFELQVEAEVARSEGRIAEALASLSDPTQHDEEVLWLVCRRLTLRAELLAASGAPNTEVESVYREAIEYADKQSGKLFELETTTSFARWLKSIGRPEQAGTLLRPIYNWFTEGFNTLDLKEAKALLNELNE
jgi:class 3 adenylate cyclase/tetratricopeptide (TPR) repeat protein